MALTLKKRNKDGEKQDGHRGTYAIINLLQSNYSTDKVRQLFFVFHYKKNFKTISIKNKAAAMIIDLFSSKKTYRYLSI
jgi:hypothetical protein